MPKAEQEQNVKSAPEEQGRTLETVEAELAEVRERIQELEGEDERIDAAMREVVSKSRDKINAKPLDADLWSSEVDPEMPKLRQRLESLPYFVWSARVAEAQLEIERCTLIQRVIAAEKKRVGPKIMGRREKIQKIQEELIALENQAASLNGREGDLKSRRARYNQLLDQLEAEPPSTETLRAFGVGKRPSSLAAFGDKNRHSSSMGQTPLRIKGN